MRCFILVMLLANGHKVPTYLNRDLIVSVNSTVRSDCPGRSWITFNNSIPGKCVAETPREVMEKPCVRKEGGAD